MARPVSSVGSLPILSGLAAGERVAPTINARSPPDTAEAAGCAAAPAVPSWPRLNAEGRPRRTEAPELYENIMLMIDSPKLPG
jgi:hypothetical protein